MNKSIKRGVDFIQHIIQNCLDIHLNKYDIAKLKITEELRKITKYYIYN